MEDAAETLTERRSAILRAVCRQYVLAGGEVGSATLARAYGFEVSTATLRQELSTLESMGMVRRPHRSAGVAPTPEGLAQYVAHLQANACDAAVQPPVARAVDRSLRGVSGGPAQGMRAAVCVLSEVSGCLAITFVGSDPTDRVRTVELVPLVGQRMLAVVEMEGGSTHMHTVDASGGTGASFSDSSSDPSSGSDGVGRLRAELRRLCSGRTLPEARTEVLRRMSEHEARVDGILARALALGLVLSQGPLDPLLLRVAGGSILAHLGVDATRLGDVLSLLEDDQRLAAVLSQLVGKADGSAMPRAHVHVGAGALLQAATQWTSRPDAVSGPARAAGEQHERLQDGPTLTLVGCPVPLVGSVGPDGRVAKRGVVALLGPDRMDYAAVIPLVEYAARALAATIDA